MLASEDGTETRAMIDKSEAMWAKVRFRQNEADQVSNELGDVTRYKEELQLKLKAMLTFKAKAIVQLKEMLAQLPALREDISILKTECLENSQESDSSAMEFITIISSLDKHIKETYLRVSVTTSQRDMIANRLNTCLSMTNILSQRCEMLKKPFLFCNDTRDLSSRLQDQYKEL